MQARLFCCCGFKPLSATRGNHLSDFLDGLCTLALEVLGRFTIQLLGSLVTNDNGRFAAFAADTFVLGSSIRAQQTHPTICI